MKKKNEIKKVKKTIIKIYLTQYYKALIISSPSPTPNKNSWLSSCEMQTANRCQTREKTVYISYLERYASSYSPSNYSASSYGYIVGSLWYVN